MKVTVLGSGTCVPSLKRSSPAYLLSADGRQILVDCGCNALLQLEKLQRSYREIDAVFVTHSHPDHIIGLVPLVHALVATPLFQREKDLFLAGPEGFKRLYKKCIASFFRKPETFSITAFEIVDKLDYPPFQVMATETRHSGDSIALRFEYGDKSVVFTGDADYDAGLIELARNADLLIADASFPESMKAAGHMTARECGLVARGAAVKKLLLSHIYILPVPEEERVHECQQVFNGEVRLAEDLMEVTV